MGGDLTLLARRRGMPTVGDLVETYALGRHRRGEISVKTLVNYRTALGQFADMCGQRPANQVGQAVIDRWLEANSRLAPSTRRHRFSLVSGFLTWAVNNGHLPRHPLRDVPAPKVPRRTPRGLPHADVVAIFDACADTRERAIAALMVQEGLRRAEVAGLQFGDIDPIARTMRVVGKGGHERVLPVTDDCAASIGRYLSEWPGVAGPLIRGWRRTAGGYVAGTSGVTPHQIGQIMSDIMYRAGVKERPGDGVSGHALRHTCATDMLRSGAHVVDVQAALGHANLATTQTYLPNVVRGLADAMGGRSYSDEVAPLDERRDPPDDGEGGGVEDVA